MKKRDGEKERRRAREMPMRENVKRKMQTHNGNDVPSSRGVNVIFHSIGFVVVSSAMYGWTR